MSQRGDQRAAPALPEVADAQPCDARLLSLVRNCPSLPSLPTVAMEVLEMTRKGKFNMRDLAAVVSKDPALAAKILQAANSSLYGLPQAVASLRAAVVLLGERTIKTLAISFSLTGVLSRYGPRGFDRMAYWRRSLYAATAAQEVAAAAGNVPVEGCFLAALLMDIGMLALEAVLGANYADVVRRAATHAGLAAVETREFGVSHADASGVLAEKWNFPPTLAVAMSHHHQPRNVADRRLRTYAEIAALAGRCADVFVGGRPAESIAEIRAACTETLRMSPIACDAMLVEVGRRTMDLAPIFAIPMDGQTTYEVLLRQAQLDRGTPDPVPGAHEPAA